MRYEVNEETLSGLYKAMMLGSCILSFNNRQGRILDMLEDREFIDNPGMVKYLLELVLDKDDTVSDRAVKCIRLNSAKLKIMDWIAFAEDIKSGGHYCFPRKQWLSLDDKNLSVLNKFGDDKVLLYGLASFHSNGYVREAALHMLNKFNTGDEILFFILRANDWVNCISILAEQLIIRRMGSTKTEYFIKYLPLAYHLKKCERKSHDKIIEKIDSVLKNAENKELLYEFLDSPDKSVRRESYRILCDIGKADSKIIEMGVRHKDCVIQKEAVNRIFSLINESNAPKYYFLLKGQNSAGARKYAPDILQFCTTLDRMSGWKSFLLDESRAAREKARYWLRKNGLSYIEINELYRKAILNGDRRFYAAVCGLGEIGEKKDAELIDPYIDTENVQLQKVVIHSIRTLNSEDYKDIFIEKLSSKWASISREARKGLDGNISPADEESLWSILNSDNIPEHVFENILILFRKMSKWRALIQFLRLFEYNYSNLENRINAEMQSWVYSFNKSYIKPSKEEISLIEQLYLAHRDKIDKMLRKEIEDLITVWK